MADFLTTIARERRERLEREALHLPTSELRRDAEARRGDARPFIASLRRPSGEPLRVIAEIKRASPSAGLLKKEFNPAEIGLEYERVGAAAISVLTEPLRFQGSVEHLRIVREAVVSPGLKTWSEPSLSVKLNNAAFDGFVPFLPLSALMTRRVPDPEVRPTTFNSTNGTYAFVVLLTKLTSCCQTPPFSEMLETG